MKVAAKPAAKSAPAKAQAKPDALKAKASPKASKVAPKVAAKTSTTPKTKPSAAPVAGFFKNFIFEDSTMDLNANVSGFQDAMSEAQTKAKAAFEKSTELMGEMTDFTKGNVEAVMASSKILAEGVQGIGSALVTESRSSFEAVSGDIKELAAAKSPTDFFKLQGDMMRKNFDSAVAYGSKNSEAMLKLMSDAMAPISGRVSLAMEKVRTVA